MSWTNDQSTQVNDSVESSIEEIILAVVAALLVVLLFFRNIRNTLTTVAGLPVILIATFIALWAFGLTINVISLLALSLSVGLVIDDAIVVRENIFRHMERGENPWVAASNGTAEVTQSVLAMTLTIIAVFLPVTLVSGTTGVIFKSFGLTVASAMAISLVEAFTLAPMLSAHLFKSKTPAEPVSQPAEAQPGAAADLTTEEGEELGWLGERYGKLLDWTLRHRWVPMALVVVILVVSVAVTIGLRFSFLPPQSSETFGLGFELPPGASLAATDKLARQAEAIIMKDPGVQAVQTSVGSGGYQYGSFTVRVRDSKQTDVVRNRLRPQLGFLPQLALSAQSFAGGSTTGVTSRNIQLQIQSTAPASAIATQADRIIQAAHSIPNIVDLGSSYTQGQPEIQFQLKDSLAADLNLSNSDISSSIRALVSGDTATTWQNNGDDIDVVVRLPPGTRADLNTINNISIPVGGQTLPLQSLGTIQQATGPTSLRRYDRQNQVVIGANVTSGADQNTVQSQLSAKVAQLGLPATYHTTFGGQTTNQNDGFSGLLVAMGLSVLFVYMVLASQFGSFTQPIVIMLAMPFSFLGAFVALRITGRALDITGIIGLIMLLGLVVKNSILLVDFTNRLRRSGMSKHAALERAGAVRLRPILMTSIAIIAGAVPTAFGIHLFSSGGGSEFRQGLAIVLIGGMLTSTLLTLLVVPTAYSLLDSLTSWVSGRFRRRKTQPAATPPTPANAGVAEAGPVAMKSEQPALTTVDHNADH